MKKNNLLLNLFLCEKIKNKIIKKFNYINAINLLFIFIFKNKDKE